MTDFMIQHNIIWNIIAVIVSIGITFIFMYCIVKLINLFEDWL